MRQWNSWGDSRVSMAIHPNARVFLEDLLGPGTPLKDATLADVIATVPASRLHSPKPVVDPNETMLQMA